MMDLLKFNRHWQEGFRYPFPKERIILSELIEQIDLRFITEICGLRRTGKTTLLFQTINTLLQRGVNPLNIWYYTFDEKTADLEGLLAEFEKQTGTSYKNEKVFVFFDEIQKLNDFQSKIKIYYDLYPEIKFFLSGSTSLFIRQKVQESLAGRIKSIFLKPLTFREYLLFSEKSHLLNKPAIHQKEIESDFEQYWHCQFIETIYIPDSKMRREYVKSILRKIIFEDITQIYNVDNPQILLEIVRMIGAQPGMYLHHENMSNDLKISQKTLVKYLTILEEAFLIKTLYNFTGNMITSQKKMKRVYLTSTSFINALDLQVEQGQMAENLFLTINDLDFFWRDVYKHEVDFVINDENQPLPVEIKYKTALKKTDMKNLRLFIQKYKPKQAKIFMKRFDMEKMQINSTPVHLNSLFNFA